MYTFDEQSNHVNIELMDQLRYESTEKLVNA